MNKPVIRLVVEDELHQNVLIRILKHFDDKFEIGDVYGFRGNSYIKKKLHAFNEASQLSPYLVLTDLDNYACPPTLIGEWVNFTISHNMIFRIAVKEAESWLLSDRKNFASYFRISAATIDLNIEAIDNPKEYLVNLARKSKNRKIREDFVPNGTALVGPNYNARLADFIHNHWDYNNARRNNRSLHKLMNRLDNFVFKPAHKLK